MFKDIRAFSFIKVATFAGTRARESEENVVKRASSAAKSFSVLPVVRLNPEKIVENVVLNEIFSQLVVKIHRIKLSLKKWVGNSQFIPS